MFGKDQIEYYRDKYRVKSARLRDFNYSETGGYFVTICTCRKVHWFGAVVGGEVRLSEIGKIAQKCWQEIPKHFPNVTPDEFVVMPNHIHGIVIIQNPVEICRRLVETCHGMSLRK